MPQLTVTEMVYQVRLLDATDQVVMVVDDLTSLYYQKTVNQVGMAILTVPAGHRILSMATPDVLMEIYLSYPKAVPSGGSGFDMVFVADFRGLYRDAQVGTDTYGNIFHLLYFPGLNEVLTREIIAWRADTPQRSKWTGVAAAYVANDIVQTNCTTFATVANGRVRTAEVVRNLIAAGAPVGTPLIDYAAAYKPVLEALQELSRIGGFDFQVDRSGGIAGNIECTLHPGQLGADKSGNIVFDTALDNVLSATVNGDRLREKTVAIVGGAGEGAARAITVRTGAHYGAKNQYEAFVDARNSSAAELPSVGDSFLIENVADARLFAEIAVSPGYVYPRDYGLGDLVTASFAGIRQVKKINQVEVTYAAGRPGKVDLRLENI